MLQSRLSRTYFPLGPQNMRIDLANINAIPRLVCSGEEQESDLASRMYLTEVVWKPTLIMFIKAVIDEDNILRDTPVSVCVCTTISQYISICLKKQFPTLRQGCRAQ